MNFEEAIERVKTRSYIARRANWDDMFIFAQVPADINEETIPKMQSLPEVVKREITEAGITSLSYQNQICKFDNGDITYYTPTGDEIFADDWETKSDDVLAKWENI
jgi:uncharacterized protein (DUF1919 family)